VTELANRTYVVTGCRTGIGATTADTLRADGARVIGVDIADADVVCDIGELGGIEGAAEQILQLAGGRLDGMVSAAGVGPTNRAPSRLLAVNAFGAIELITRLRPALERGRQPRVVIVSSNTISCHQNPVSRELIESCLAKPRQEMLERVDREITSEVAYAVSKIVLTTWARTQAPKEEWIGRGLYLNVVAPGSTDTAMFIERTLDGNLKAAALAFPNPLGRLLAASEVALVIRFALDPAMVAMAGSVIFCDGGVDALFHPGRPEPFRSIA
jgi:NAD(P)-dependent dehydrogenase (short-subunit alcohol dehydrogenase family)